MGGRGWDRGRTGLGVREEGGGRRRRRWMEVVSCNKSNLNLELTRWRDY